MADNREPAALTPFDAGKAIALTFVVSAVAAPFLGSRSGIVGDLATSIIAPAVCAVFVWRKRLSFRESFSLGAVDLRDLAIPTAVFLLIKNMELGLMATADIISRGALSRWGNVYPTAGEGRTLAANMVMAALVAPIVEELAFRGVILNSFRQWNYGWGAIIPSVIFASMHHPMGIPGAFVAGVTFALFAIKHGSILASTVVHSVANAYLVFLDGVTHNLPEPEQNVLCALIGLVTLILVISRRQWFKNLWQDYRWLWRQFREPDQFRPRLKALLRHWSYIVIIMFILLTMVAVIAAPYLEWMREAYSPA